MVEEIVPGLQLNPLMTFNFAVSFPQLPDFAYIKFHATSVTLPAYGFNFDTRYEANDPMSYASEEFVSETMSISFVETHDGAVTAFLAYMRDLVRDPASRKRKLPSAYKTEILVRKLGRDLQPRIAWRALGAFLNKVGPVMMDSDDSGFVTIPTVFSVDDFELDPIDPPTANVATTGSPRFLSQRNSLLSLSR